MIKNIKDYVVDQIQQLKKDLNDPSKYKKNPYPHEKQVILKKEEGENINDG